MKMISNSKPLITLEPTNLPDNQISLQKRSFETFNSESTSSVPHGTALSSVSTHTTHVLQPSKSFELQMQTTYPLMLPKLSAIAPMLPPNLVQQHCLIRFASELTVLGKNENREFLTDGIHRLFMRKTAPINSDDKVSKEYYFLLQIHKSIPHLSHGQIPCNIALYQNQSACTCALYMLSSHNSLSMMIYTHGVPPLSITRHILLNLIPIISELHSKVISHRGICLENVFINKENYSVSICGFDYATCKCTEYTSEQCGADLYKPPETTYFPRQYDVYSIGVLLFVLVFGYSIKQTVEGKEEIIASTRDLIKKPWSNRCNWKILRGMLKKRGYTTDEMNSLRELLQNLLSKCADSRMNSHTILSNSWIKDYHQATTSDLMEYFSRIT